MPENNNKDVLVDTKTPSVIDKQSSEQEQFSRRQALKRLGVTSTMAAFALLNADDLARMVGNVLQQRVGGNELAEQISRELRGEGLALADDASSISTSDPVSGSLGAIICGWDQATVANGTPDQQTAYSDSVSYTLAQLLSTDALYYVTTPSDAYYNNVSLLQQNNNQIKAKLLGDILLASVPPQGSTVTVAGGDYTLGIDPTGGAFSLFDGSTGQLIQTTPDLGDHLSYLIPYDIIVLPYASGALDSNGDITNYSEECLQSVIQFGSSASASLSQAEQQQLAETAA